MISDRDCGFLICYIAMLVYLVHIHDIVYTSRPLTVIVNPRARMRSEGLL